MSRRYPHGCQPRNIVPYNENPYQPTTLEYPIPHTYKHHKNGHQKNHYLNRPKLYYNEPPPLESCFSDETISCYEDGYESVPNHFDSRLAEYTFSDISDSPRVHSVQYYEEIPPRRQSVYNTVSETSGKRTNFSFREDKLPAYQNKELRKQYSTQGSVCETCYDVERGDVNTLAVNLPKRGPVSRISDRPQSSQGSSVTSAVIHACGGRCQTCENICYYFLQVAFVMGILIGISLSIAGSVLRKSAARNLQVLIYIGSLCAMVCLLLLCIQCRSKHNSKRRKPTTKTVSRSPIPLETIGVPTASVPSQQQQQPLMPNESQRGLPVPPQSLAIQQVQKVRQRSPNETIEEPGIPWWRRKDIVNNR